MSCSYKPNIHLVSSTAAQAFEFLFLQYSEQFGLQLRRNVADLVKEEGALVGQLEPAKFLRNGSSERALFVAEQLAFQQIQWDGSAVQLDERASAPRADIVNRARN
jgi:hypothetical protein